ncbi:MAG TPA: hypothetical protein PKA42_00850 [Candidatus Paceibacterota bacterium]|nr:hypothetical protein [Candidatus Paceibacterota bacterium]HMO82691.1 hypothetical protein [Candidatus Paceibacterota bacterium]
MNTKFVGVKEFRQNISDYAKQARNEDIRFIIVNRNKPLFEIKSFAEDQTLDTIFAEVKKAEKDISTGKYYSQEELLAELA